MLRNENKEPSACTLLILLQPAGLLRVTSDQKCAALCCGIKWPPCSCQQLHRALPTLLYHQSRSREGPTVLPLQRRLPQQCSEGSVLLCPSLVILIQVHASLRAVQSHHIVRSIGLPEPSLTAVPLPDTRPLQLTQQLARRRQRRGQPPGAPAPARHPSQQRWRQLQTWAPQLESQGPTPRRRQRRTQRKPSCRCCCQAPCCCLRTGGVKRQTAASKGIARPAQYGVTVLLAVQAAILHLHPELRRSSCCWCSCRHVHAADQLRMVVLTHCRVGCQRAAIDGGGARSRSRCRCRHRFRGCCGDSTVCSGARGGLWCCRLWCWRL